MKLRMKLQDVPCPVFLDGSSCPNGNTCCVLSSGAYGCCPIGILFPSFLFLLN